MNQPEIKLNLSLVLSKITYFSLGAVCVIVIYLAITWGKDPIEPNPVRRKSPTAIANIVHPPTNTYIKIVYGQPYKRGRQVYGNLVSYNEIWRTGANEATELTTTRPIMFDDKKLAAGTYTLFTIPRKDEPWTIILNSQLGQWGGFNYDPNHDVLRVDLPAKQVETTAEAFSIYFSNLKQNPTEIPILKQDSTHIVMIWDHTKVEIPVEFIE